MKKKSLDNFTNDQLSRWPLARDNYRALKNASVRTMVLGGLQVTLQFNPARIVSTAAKVDAASVQKRKCFLCRDNRPSGQISMRFDGRKGKKYDILVNPYPIFHEHLVIAMDRHCDQSIWKRYVDVLDMAKTWQDHVFMYNGPKCGASAPDHHHFQAAQRGVMPLEQDIDGLMDGLHPLESSRMGLYGDDVKTGKCGTDGVLEYLSSVKEAELYHYRKYARGVFALRARTAKSMAKLFYRLLDCAPVREGDNEPMFNLLVWYSGSEYRSAVMFRERHRPHHYFSEGPDRLMMSPGCADMAGFFVMPERADYERMTPELLSEVLDEVAVSPEGEDMMIRRLQRPQPLLSVGLMSAPEIVFEILSDGAGVRKAVWNDGKIEYDGALYDELYFEEQTPSTMFAEPGFVLHGVTIGVGFHWERKEDQCFAGALKITVAGDKLLAINIIGVEDYLLSVISSEMKSTSSLELLKAHAVISRSWVMSRIAARKGGAGHDRSESPDMTERTAGEMMPEDGRHDSATENADVLVKWYDHEDHSDFDVCADDHCQRYQGLTRATGKTVRKAIDSTWGEVLMYDGEVCDARFSKCCGGMTERFSTCWEDRDLPYLCPVRDMPSGNMDSSENVIPDLSTEEGVRKWILNPEMAGASPAFCSTGDHEILTQVLNDYDRESPDFFRWRISYGREELSELVERRSGRRIGLITALVPLHRGTSGRIDLLKISGTDGSLVVGKELEIRKILSESHLKSSAFTVDYLDDRIVLSGAGWGHGVGLCQIGAAVMASEGYLYREILSHYYPGASVSIFSVH